MTSTLWGLYCYPQRAQKTAVISPLLMHGMPPISLRSTRGITVWETSMVASETHKRWCKKLAENQKVLKAKILWGMRRLKAPCYKDFRGFPSMAKMQTVFLLWGGIRFYTQTVVGSTEIVLVPESAQGRFRCWQESTAFSSDIAMPLSAKYSPLCVVVNRNT